ncbi:MAG: hypothetical protein WBW49_05710, partial [Candidatus Acidiferrum sp.]
RILGSAFLEKLLKQHRVMPVTENQPPPLHNTLRNGQTISRGGFDRRAPGLDRQPASYGV